MKSYERRTQKKEELTKSSARRYRSRDDQFFGTAFAALEGLLDAPKPLGEHPAYDQLRAYAENALDEERTSIVSLHLLTCKDCQKDVWKERLQRAPFPKKLVRIDHQAALIYALVTVVMLVGFSWGWLAEQFSLVELAAVVGGRGGYPPPRPM